jgi:hypothetical protein
MKKIPTIHSKSKPKILVGINSLVSSMQPAYSNHIQLFYRLGRSYSKIDFALYNPSRMSIDRMRNQCAETALDMEASHLLFIDDDVLIPHPYDFLEKLLACKADIAAADVLIRGWPFDHMFFNYSDKEHIGLRAVSKVKKPLGPIEVDAVGFSCCLISVELLKKLRKPYFVTGLNNTEDIYFCVLAKDTDPKCKIMVDTSIKCGHIFGPEIIDSDNITNYRQYFKKQFMPQLTDKEKQFRGINYYNVMQNSFKEANKNEKA